MAAQPGYYSCRKLSRQTTTSMLTSQFIPKTLRQDLGHGRDGQPPPILRAGTMM